MRWIKVDVGILNKPAIRAAAADCGVDIANAFVAWFRLYSWLDENTADGVLPTDRAEVDAIARLPGFAASLERSGWLTFNGETCTVTNWGSHNGQCAKRRAQSAQLMTQLREERRRNGQQVKPLPAMPTRRKNGC